MTDWPRGVGFRRLNDVDSTNAEAQRLASVGQTGPLWILAHRQTSGRGRRGRPWTDHPGNFYGTFLFTPSGEPRDAALRSFTAALALRDALTEVTGRAELFSLKWPNDVLLSGRKLAGILLEMCPAPRREKQALAVGIGVNLAHAPEPGLLEAGALEPVSLADATGFAIAPEDFAIFLANAFARWEATYERGGFTPLRKAWLGAATGLGRQIVARLPGREIHGTFGGIDTSGAIQLDTAEGRVTLPAAEIHFRRQVSGGTGELNASGN
ncbi:biotin--[acetyl-CoA-carboxylase] ligase [Amaricoccus macauensis]|uniref:biotin--[acetyl-CoA-carboxylase] ligase n=1 Tax=Amaricoccus macauensis TaxID=57001 RepID=UPI003C7AC06D